jgi:hypothetical protein
MNMQDDPGGVMVFNTTFNIISVISWQSVLVEESGVLGEAADTDKLYHIKFYRVQLMYLAWTLVVMGIYCIGSYINPITLQSRPHTRQSKITQWHKFKEKDCGFTFQSQ